MNIIIKMIVIISNELLLIDTSALFGILKISIHCCMISVVSVEICC